MTNHVHPPDQVIGYGAAVKQFIDEQRKESEGQGAPVPPPENPNDPASPALPELPAAAGGGYPAIPDHQPGFTLGTAGDLLSWVGANLYEVVVAARTNVVGSNCSTHVNGTWTTHVGGDVTNHYFASKLETITTNLTVVVGGDLNETVAGEVHRTEGPMAVHVQTGVFMHHINGMETHSVLGGKLYVYAPWVHHQIGGMETVNILGQKVESVAAGIFEKAPFIKHFHSLFFVQVGGTLLRLIPGLIENKTTAHKIKASKLLEEADELEMLSKLMKTNATNYELDVAGQWLCEAGTLEAKASKESHKASLWEAFGGKFKAADGALEAE